MPSTGVLRAVQRPVRPGHRAESPVKTQRNRTPAADNALGTRGAAGLWASAPDRTDRQEANHDRTGEPALHDLLPPGDSVEELRILTTAPLQVRFCADECASVWSEGVSGARAEHDRLEGVYGALRAALIDHALSAEQRAPYTEAAARVVTRQLEFTAAALAPQSE
jgi:hypothetical protein